ncbi:MAG: hypothetical protein ACXWLQ_01860 [Rhizomicrobium sp.]
MSVVNEPGMEEERFAVLVEAYGGDPARWPMDEREPAMRLLASSLVAQTAAAAARRLDQSMATAVTAPVYPALAAKLLADFDRVSQRPSLRQVVSAVAQIVWPGAPVWQPATAFGLALAIGIGIAALAPFDTPQADDMSGGVFALDGTPDTDGGQGI